jgi:hypothetical protein
MAKKNTTPQEQQSKPMSVVKRPSFAWYLVVMPLLVLAWGFFYFEKGEIIALNNGCGWDGVTYKNVVWSLQWNKSDPVLQERGRLRVDPYRAQRIAPSVAVYGEMQVAKWLYQRIVPMFDRVPTWLEWSYEQYPLPPWFFRWFAKDGAVGGQQSVSLTIDSFVAGYFVIHGLLMLVGTAVFWALIAQNLALGAVAQYLGFTALFVNVAMMKMSLYYPTLTDGTAAFIGTATLYAYLSRKNWLLLPFAAIGFFTFPTAFYVAMILFIFPRNSLAAQELAAIPQPNAINKRTARFIAAGATVLVMLLSVYLVLIAEVRFPEVEPVHRILLPLTMPLLFAQFFFTVEQILLIAPISSIMAMVRSQREMLGYALRIGINLALWGALFYGKRQFEDPSLSAPMNADLFLGGSFACAVSKPLLTLVALVVYFGPMLLLGVLYFRQFLRTALTLGLGFFVVIVILLLLVTIMTETRQLINFLPFVVVTIAMLLNQATVRPTAVIVLSLMSVVCSKIWLSLNFPGMPEQAANIQNGSFTAFPLQYYFMNHGPWMSMNAYLVQSALVLICCGVVLWAFPLSKNDV